MFNRCLVFIGFLFRHLLEDCALHVLGEVVEEQPVSELAAVDDVDDVHGVKLGVRGSLEHHHVELGGATVQEERGNAPDHSCNNE